MKQCPCGSKQDYNVCCGLYLDGKQLPATPEALMRSRYTAFTKANIDYIQATMMGEAAKDFDPIQTKQWALAAKWMGLAVLYREMDPKDDHHGFVEFVAHYELQNQVHRIHEYSEFQRVNDRWYYVDGQQGPRPLRPASEPGRNDPCPCGSGKKYKKCCGASH